MGAKISVIDKLIYGIEFVHRIKNESDPKQQTVVKNFHEAAKRLCTKDANKKEPITPKHIDSVYEYLFTKVGVNLTTLRTFALFTLFLCVSRKWPTLDNVKH